MNTTTSALKCSFAHAGTYGHECGRPATLIAVKDATVGYTGAVSWMPVPKPGDTYQTGRCDECAKIKGGENRGLIRLEAV